ncbi:uncharacterized protein LOC123552052 [Mercenaria mercenaria]|uniref:uncharacterized protein LOC123552052 n=1 Tax=Mercenaria mercenaria TaxID=6596 RepID=UPI001E1D40CD|nr:uncharacterized protein LOC123552052 [Mercenaria mercenaria]
MVCYQYRDNVGNGVAGSFKELNLVIINFVKGLLLNLAFSNKKMLQKKFIENMDQGSYTPRFTELSYDIKPISNADTSDKDYAVIDKIVNGRENNKHVTSALPLETILSLRKKNPYLLFPEKIHFDLGTDISPNGKHGIISNRRLIFCPKPVLKDFIDYLLTTSEDSKTAILQDNDRKCKVLVLMPEYTSKNEDHLRQLVSFLIHSKNQTFPIDIGSGLEIKPGKYGGLTTVIKQKNNVTKKFTLRLNVVTSEMFEEAMRNAQLFSLELAYSNIFPSDCRMFICLPVYKDGYINRKDKKDRGQNI